MLRRPGHEPSCCFWCSAATRTLSLSPPIDPAYAKAFADARGCGVEAHAFACTLTMEGLMQPRAIAIVASEQGPAIAPAHF